jgi:hypothetical protein
LHDAETRANRLGYVTAVTDGKKFDRDLMFVAAIAQTGIEERKKALGDMRTAIDTAVKALGKLREAAQLQDLSDVQSDQGTLVTNPDGSRVFVLRSMCRTATPTEWPV